MNQKCLANIYDRDPAALAKTLDRMERNGLVVRTKDENDKRAYLISLTNKGRDLRDKIEPLASQSLQEAFADFSGSEIRTLKELLLKITK